MGIRQVKQAMNSSTVIQAINDGKIDKKDFEKKLREYSRPLSSLLSDEGDVEDDELLLALALSTSIQTAQDELRRRDEEQQHSMQEALPEDGQEEHDHDLEDDELQLALALSASIHTEQDEQRRRDEEQLQHAAQSRQETLQSEDDLEKMCSVLSSENDRDLEDETLRLAIALSLEENIEQRTLLEKENTWSDDS